MTSIDDNTLFAWIDLAADGGLEADAQEALEKALESRHELRRESDRLAGLNALLKADRIDVRPGFSQRVIESLAPAPWQQAPQAGAWRLPMAIAAVFAVASALILSLAGDAGTGAVSTFAAIGDFLKTTTLTGAGLLGASWSGLTLAVDELFSEARSGLVALVIGVVLLDLLFLRMLRRGARASARSSSDRSATDER